MQPDLAAWEAWRPTEIAARLSGVPIVWCVAGGWALSLFRGAPLREHSDLEIAVPAKEFDRLAAAFGDCTFAVPADGVVLAVSAETLRAEHQTWARERRTGKWRFDVFREPSDGDLWICRRNPAIRRPYPEVIRHDAAGIPYLAPEIVLLFKAKATRPKDAADFAAVLPLLAPAEREWLDRALALTHPDHPWRPALR